MCDVDELEWIDCSETIEDILTNPRVILPQLIKLSTPVTCAATGKTLNSEQIVLIHEKQTLSKLECTDKNDSKASLPVNCPYPIKLTLAPGKEKIFSSISELAKAEPLPKFVEVTSVNDFDGVSVGNRLKVVIVEKSGSTPSFIHFRNSAGKHVKISINQEISFKLAVNNASERLLVDVAKKSRQFPINLEFEQNDDVSSQYFNLGVVTILKEFEEDVVIASVKKDSKETVFVFPLLAPNFKYKVTSKLKLAKDEEYRQLCDSHSNVDVSDVLDYLNTANPTDKETLYVIDYGKLSNSEDSENEEDFKGDRKSKIQLDNKPAGELDSESTPKEDEVVLHVDTEQQEIIKKQTKENERLAKFEKERLKAEAKKLKKEKKEKEKEAKRQKKAAQKSNTRSLEVNSKAQIELVDEDMYIVPQSSSAPVSPQTPQPEPDIPVDSDSSSQWAMHLMNKMKKVRDRTKSVGVKPKKKRPALKKSDIVTMSSENLSEELYTGLHDDEDEAFSESLYETLPCDMAYESLDLLKHTQRSMAPSTSTENSGDSGFDEADQAKIRAWRESMMPPPLPGNHPVRNPSAPVIDDIYEVAIDSNVNPSKQNDTALAQLMSIIERSAQTIATFDMEDVAKCLEDLQLKNYVHVFKDSMVDGQLLLDLDESVLVDLGLNAFEARKLRKFIFGWRPDGIRPSSYSTLKGFESDDPIDWSENDVAAHLNVIEINDFADFCLLNQVNGELLKDICVDETIMNSIITTRDKKIKRVKIKNYVIDKWRPKKTGEGNYIKVNTEKSQSLKTKDTKASPPLNKSYNRAQSVPTIQFSSMKKSETSSTSAYDTPAKATPSPNKYNPVENKANTISAFKTDRTPFKRFTAPVTSDTQPSSLAKSETFSHKSSSPKFAAKSTSLAKSETFSQRGSPQLETKSAVIRGRKISSSAKLPQCDAPMVARMKMQLEENKNDWQKRVVKQE